MATKHRRLNPAREMTVRQYETADGVRYAVLDTGLLTAFAVSEALMTGGGHVAIIRENGGSPRECHAKVRGTLDDLKASSHVLRGELARRRPAFGSAKRMAPEIQAVLGQPERL